MFIHGDKYLDTNNKNPDSTVVYVAHVQNIKYINILFQQIENFHIYKSKTIFLFSFLMWLCLSHSLYFDFRKL